MNETVGLLETVKPKQRSSIYAQWITVKVIDLASILVGLLRSRFLERPRKGDFRIPIQ
jgi:hypothetical protein